MKKSVIISFCNLFVLLFIAFVTSCDKNFDGINTNPDAVVTPDPALLFTKSQYDGVRHMSSSMIGVMQYTTSYNDVSGFGSKYLLSQVNRSSDVFNLSYQDEIVEIAEVIRAVTGVPAKVNQLAQARIWRVYCFSKITDLYGDIPYSEAAKAFTDGIYRPKYDPQKNIYIDMLGELESAAQSMDPSSETFGTADLLYQGDVSKWKKFAYSMMLRLGMRLTKVEPAMAESWVKKAIAGGVILNEADIAKINYVNPGQDISKNPFSLYLFTNDYSKADGLSNQEGGKYQENFINYLKENRDPRLGVISVVYTGPEGSRIADTSFSLQKGMPATLSSKPVNFGELSEPNPLTVVKLDAPRLLFTVAESNFLLAEANLRGWYSGDAAASYINGVNAAMKQWAIIGGAAGIISQEKIDTYLQMHPFDAPGSFDQKMNQIHTQFWVGLFPDCQEVYSNYRRTGFPALVPNNYPGNATNGQIFRRCIYPVSEINLNSVSYQQAIERQGPDLLTTRVWWDKQ